MRIAAVVVTYNRLKILKICIDSLRMQSKKIDEIIVVNNGSSDGTNEWLSEQKDLTQIIQGNLGSAGGQYTGIKEAFRKGYDWVWTMDDDGRAEPNTLECLLKYAYKDDIVLHPLVLAEDKKTFSFGCWLNPNTNEQILLKTMEEFDKYQTFQNKMLPSYGTPFNGTLIPRKVIQEIGFPDPKYFIWGEESEYMKRIAKYGYKSYVIKDAIFIHPYNSCIFSILEFEDRDWWKLYYLFRNRREVHFYNDNKIIGALKYLNQNFKSILQILFTNKRHKQYKITLILLATFHSLIGRYGKYSKTLHI